MGSLRKFKEFCDRNIVYIVCIPGIAGIHWAWQAMQENKKFVAEHERREFPPLTLYKFAKYFVGLGPMPEKHTPYAHAEGKPKSDN